MRAYVLTGPDTAPALSDVAVPDPAGGEVLVRVAASSINPHDAMVASGAAARYMTYDFPVVLGSDLAGTVEAVGSGVDDLVPGERVFGLLRERVAARGSFAEFVAVPRDWVTPTPEALDDDAAGALGLAALTALRCVEAVDPAEGEVVVVNGATGGVGSYVVQLLAARHAVPVATARPGPEDEHVRDMGAEEVVDWTAGDLARQVRSLHPEGVAAVIDLVTRDTDAFTALATAVLGPGGRVVCTGHAADPERLPGVRAVNVLAEADRSAVEAIAELAESGALRAPITRRFGLDQLDEAFAALRNGAVGKIAVHTGS